MAGIENQKNPTPENTGTPPAQPSAPAAEAAAPKADAAAANPAQKDAAAPAPQKPEQKNASAKEAESNSLRFKYEELTSRNKDLADKFAALIIAYPDIVKLGDPKAQQDFLDRFSESQAGKETLALVSEAKNMGKNTVNLITGLAGVKMFSTDADEGKGTINALKKGAGIVALPATVTIAALGTAFNEAKVLFNDITPEKAKLIGVRYASAMQAQEVEREDKFAWGAFTSFSNVRAVTKALLTSAVDWIVDKLPEDMGITSWLHKQGFNGKRTLSENLNRQFIEADVKIAASEMKKLKQRDGIDFEATAGLLEPGAEVQNRAGQNQAVTPPTAENPVPTLQNAERDEKGNPIQKAADKEEVLADAVSRSGAAIKDKFAKATDGIDTYTQAAVATGGAIATAELVRGGAEGVARQHLKAPADRAKSLHNKADRLLDKITDPNLETRQHKWELWKPTTEKVAEMTKEQATLEAAAKDAEQVAAKRLAHASNFTREAQKPLTSDGWFKKLLHAPRNLGRAGGDVAGIVIEGTAHQSVELGEKALGTGVKAVVKSAETSLKLGRGLLTIAKFGRGIPLVGAIATGALLKYSHSANAEEVNGEKLSYLDQLDYDRKQGKVSDKEYAYYRSLQTAYGISGFGGIFTAGGTELVQNGLEYADPKKMERYLPESLVNTISGMFKGDKSSTPAPQKQAGFTNEELAAAYEGVRNQAQKGNTQQAHAAAKPIAERLVAFAKVAYNEMGATAQDAASHTPQKPAVESRQHA